MNKQPEGTQKAQVTVLSAGQVSAAAGTDSCDAVCALAALTAAAGPAAPVPCIPVPPLESALCHADKTHANAVLAAGCEARES